MTKSNLTADAVDDVEEGLSPEQSRARARLRKLIDEQGIKPITAEQLHAMGDLWPEDESVDDFIAAVREWRRDGNTRRLP
ncbi:MAG TPA: hypothetical protein VLU47_02375 [Blastocatellia bacterium]|nr:hypothetical protein [Blastocatellia bacterium]